MCPQFAAINHASNSVQSLRRYVYQKECRGDAVTLGQGLIQASTRRRSVLPPGRST